MVAKTPVLTDEQIIGEQPPPRRIPKHYRLSSREGARRRARRRGSRGNRHPIIERRRNWALHSLTFDIEMPSAKNGKTKRRNHGRNC